MNTFVNRVLAVNPKKPYNLAMKNSNWQNKKAIKIILLVMLAGLITTWVTLTPEGVDGKLHAVGFAICHQIESHTLEIGGKFLPLCARCTGMFLGTLTAILFLTSKDRSAGKPSKLKIAVLGILLLLFMFDGVNSSITLFPALKPLYPPTNWLRLATGLSMGVILANLLLPLWNQTLWQDQNPSPVLKTWKQMILLFAVEAIIGLLVWLDIPLLYYPVAVLSIGTIVLILSMVYSMLWMIILNKENSLKQFKEGILFFLLGAITALVQIGLMDLVRFSITGAWSGFQL